MWGNFDALRGAIVLEWFGQHARRMLIDDADRPATLTPDLAWEIVLALWLLRKPDAPAAAPGLPELSDWESPLGGRKTALPEEFRTELGWSRAFERATGAFELLRVQIMAERLTVDAGLRLLASAESWRLDG